MPGKLVLDSRMGILKMENTKKKTTKKNDEVPAHLAQLDSVLLSGFLLPKRGQGLVLKRLDKTYLDSCSLR